MSVIRRLALTVSDVHSRLVCFQSTSTSNALEVLHSMRYINLRLTYLLTSTVGRDINTQYLRFLAVAAPDSYER